MCFSDSVPRPAKNQETGEDEDVWQVSEGGRAGGRVQIRFNGFAPPNEYVNLARLNHHRPHYHLLGQLLLLHHSGVQEAVEREQDATDQRGPHLRQGNEMNTVSTGGGGGGGGGSMGKKNCDDEVMTVSSSDSFSAPLIPIPR